MNDWEKFNETSLSDDFKSHLNIEDITDADYAHTKRIFKDFEIKHLGEYYDLFVQSDSLFSADITENFRNICLEIYELDLYSFWISMASSFKKDKNKIKFFN